MDIYCHAATGAVAGLALASSRLRGTAVRRRTAIAACTVGAVLPDLDALSLGLGGWGRRVYYGDYWYSHHHFSHSLLGAALIALAAAWIWSRYRGWRGRPAALSSLAALVFAGCVVHLLGDLPTPPGPWGGLPLLFPLSSDFGGWARVWWWHNYYVMYVCLGALLAGAVLYGIEKLRPSARSLTRGLQTLAALIALSLCVYYFSQSRFDPSGSWYQKDARAQEIQKDWLPGRVHRVFVRASGVLPLYF
jgi:membrane-bound metal-dependent hydrolase YbcI (DUF457 family)